MISHPLSHAQLFGSISFQISPTIEATRIKTHPPVENCFGYIFVSTSIKAVLQRSISFIQKIVEVPIFLGEQAFQDSEAIQPLTLSWIHLKGFVACKKIQCFSQFQNLPILFAYLAALFIGSSQKARLKLSLFEVSVECVQKRSNASLRANNATIGNKWSI